MQQHRMDWHLCCKHANVLLKGSLTLRWAPMQL